MRVSSFAYDSSLRKGRDETRRHELTDEEWAIIAPLPPNKPRGVPYVDDRRVSNGILWRGAPRGTMMALHVGPRILWRFRTGPL